MICIYIYIYMWWNLGHCWTLLDTCGWSDILTSTYRDINCTAYLYSFFFIAWDVVTMDLAWKCLVLLATKAQTRQLATCKSVVPTDPRQRFGCFWKMGYQLCYVRQIMGEMLINQWLEWTIYFETHFIRWTQRETPFPMCFGDGWW